VGAIKSGDGNRVQIDREICTECLLCTKACPSLALNVYGETMTVEQVIGKVEEDSAFYSRSGGGLTIGGGEPMHQAEFAASLLKEAKRRRINTAMETCGFCNWETLENVCGFLATLLYDVKSMDPEKHRAFTGVSNELILENLRRVRETFPDLSVWVRTPIIPGFNDDPEDIRRILEHIQGMPNTWFEALDYHRMGKPKYEYLGLEFPMGDQKLDEEKIRRIHKMIRSEFPHLRSPGTAENGKLQSAASQR
jgi:pyruvate formate lyase activating enzyme